MIKFNTVNQKEKAPKFKDVKEDQFFVNNEDALCQKAGQYSYSVIARADGRPWCVVGEHAEPEESITRILPEVTSIEF